jgi:hypothetical protein
MLIPKPMFEALLAEVSAVERDRSRGPTVIPLPTTPNAGIPAEETGPCQDVRLGPASGTGSLGSGGDSIKASCNGVNALGGGRDARTRVAGFRNRSDPGFIGLISDKARSGGPVNAGGKAGKFRGSSISIGISSGVGFLVATGVDGIVATNSDDSSCFLSAVLVCRLRLDDNGGIIMLESLEGVLGLDFSTSAARRTDVGTRFNRIAPEEDVGLSPETECPDRDVPFASLLAVFAHGDGSGFSGEMFEIACGNIGAARLRESPLLLLIDSLRPSEPLCENSDMRLDLMGL